MRKINQEITDPGTLEEILFGARICRLAICDGEKPYLLPFNYGYRERCIYIHSAPEGKKIELLQLNPHVCFEVEDLVTIVLAEEPTANMDSKTGQGLLEMMKTLNEKKEVTFIFSTHDPMVMDYARRLIEIRDGRVA